MTPGRRGYLDWLRGVAVLIMIEAHTIDSWTRPTDRERVPFGYAMILGGFGAPIFLFLAGVAIVMAAGGRVRKGATLAEAAAAARRRGWQIFALAFLFRLQSWLLGGGAPWQTLLKVDILNIMGLAMVGAATLWGLMQRNAWRALALGAATVALAMLTPIVRASAWLAVLPDPIEWYLRPYPGRTTFTLFPWAGFLFAGAVLGVWLDAARTPAEERRLNLAVAVAGPAIALAGYAASYLPPIYAQTNFWTSSPTFFFLRLGVLLCLVPLAYAWERRTTLARSGRFATRRASAGWRSAAGGPPRRGRREDPSRRWEVLQEFGRASLFVYWIHVEMVYGVISAGLYKRLTFEQALAAFALFSVFLFGVVKVKDRVVAWWTAGRLPPFAAGAASAPKEGGPYEDIASGS